MDQNFCQAGSMVISMRQNKHQNFAVKASAKCASIVPVYEIDFPAIRRQTAYQRARGIP
jgi:hypothetical protein